VPHGLSTGREADMSAPVKRADTCHSARATAASRAKAGVAVSGRRDLSHGGPRTDEMTRDDSRAAERERAVFDVLTSIRGHYTAIANQMRAGGAEAYELVSSRMAERLLLCPVTVRPGRDTTAIEVQLSAARAWTAASCATFRDSPRRTGPRDRPPRPRSSPRRSPQCPG
jgi:hypothetical protein